MRKSECFLALNAKGRTICLISRKNATFKILKTPAIIWPAKTWSMRRPSARLLYDSCNCHCLQLFPKKWTFQNPEDSPHNFARREASPEAPKVQIPVRFLKIIVFAIFKKNMAFSENTRARRRADPTCGRPGKGTNPDTITILENVVRVLAAKVPTLAVLTSVA